MTHVFALTGGIGTGKSTVSSYLRTLGIPVVDADLLARDVVLPGTIGFKELISVFGADIIDEDGFIDRKSLAIKVFDSPRKLAVLNSILHPLIHTAAHEAFAQITDPIACYDIPLLFETKQQDNYRPVVVVTCNYELQLARAMKRDSASKELIEKRMAAQLPMTEKVLGADYIIENNSDINALQQQIDIILKKIIEHL